MKKHIFLFLGIISLTACATFQQQAFDWRGQNFDDLVVKYGVPNSQYTLQNESVAYSFVKPCQYTQGQEEVVVVVNTDNTIYDISNVSRCSTPVTEIYYTEYVSPQPIYIKNRHEKTPPPAHHVNPKPDPAPAPAPKPEPAPKPNPTPQASATPKPTPTPAPAQQKPQDNPAPKPQEQAPSQAQNVKPIIDKQDNNDKQNKEKLNIFNQVKEKKTSIPVTSKNKQTILPPNLEQIKQNNTNSIISKPVTIQKQNSSNQAQEVKQETKKEMPIKQNQTKVAKLFKK